MTCEWFETKSHQIDGEHRIGCKDSAVHGTKYCFEHGARSLSRMYSKRTSMSKELLKLDKDIADLESALETR